MSDVISTQRTAVDSRTVLPDEMQGNTMSFDYQRKLAVVRKLCFGSLLLGHVPYRNHALKIPMLFTLAILLASVAFPSHAQRTEAAAMAACVQASQNAASTHDMPVTDFACRDIGDLYGTPCDVGAPGGPLFPGSWLDLEAYDCTTEPTGKNMGNGGHAAGGEGGGGGAASPMAGDPINISTGNKYVEETDYDDTKWLTLRRFYNSISSTGFTPLGVYWRLSFYRSLQQFGSPASLI
jgi:hypothetical protein